MIEVLFTLLYPYLWAGTQEDGYFKVWMLEANPGDLCILDDIPFGPTFGNKTGCYVNYDGTIHSITILKGYEFTLDSYNCNTVWDHEWLHAMGVEHGEKPLVTC
jgi:hypothetical protein